MYKKIIFILIAVLAIGGIFLFINAPKQSSDFAKLQSSLSKYLVDSYKLTGIEYGQIYRAYEVEYNNGNYHVKITTPYYSKELYRVDGKDSLCISYKDLYACGNKTSNQLRALVFEKDQVLNDIKNNELLYNESALIFYNSSFDNCLNYSIDYNRLSVDQLKQIGIQPNSALTLIGKFDFIRCLDENNNTINLTMDYNLEGTHYTYFRTFDMQPYNSTIKAPELSSNFDYVENTYTSVITDIYNCKKQPNPDNCIMGVALDEDNIGICSQIEDKKNRDLCEFRLVILHKNPAKCSSITMRDDCYLELAYQLNTTELCNNINNESKKEECYNIFKTSD